MKLSSIVLIIALLTSCNGYSQIENKIIPPSPEASSLGKFVESPISLYTGTSQIEIPFFSKKIDNIPINVSISYHSKGVKVDEIASRVGLGWAINAGGQIMRQIRGSADDSPYGYLRQHNGKYLYPSIFTDTNYRINLFGSLQAEGARPDLNPDLFIFNFMGNSGKFIIDCNTKETIIQKHSNLKIVPIFNSQEIITGFECIDEMGNRYFFGEYQGVKARDSENSESYLYKDNSGYSLTGNSTENNFTSWHLIKIITANSTVITFTYEIEDTIYYRKSIDNKLKNIFYSAFSKVYATQYQIKEILFPNGKITFNKKNIVREDLNLSYQLDNIEISANNQNVKQYDFKYHYTTSATDSNGLYILKGLEPQAAKRLFLEEILENNKSRYQFIYNRTKLPNRFSSSQDNWGFYNGKNNGYYLTFLGSGTEAFPNDRQVDTTLCKAGLLEKIIYPTKGYSQYNYEANLVKKPPFYDNLDYRNSNPVIEKASGLFKIDSLWNFNTFTYKQNFTIKSSFVPNSFKSKVSLSNIQNCGTDRYLSGCSYRVVLRGNGKTFELFRGIKSLSNIQPGNYEIEVIPYDTSDENRADYTNNFIVTVSWQEKSTLDDNLIHAGGNRVSQIKTFDHNTNIISEKNYEYLDVVGNTSGLVHSLPAFFPIAFKTDQIIIYGKSWGVKPGGPLTDLQGNNIGYSTVTEYFGNSTNNTGKIIYNFTNPLDSGKYYLTPFCPPTDNEWLRGILLNKKYYKSINSGLSYEITKQEDFTYKFADDIDFLNNTVPLDGAGFNMADGTYPSYYNPRIKKRMDFAKIDLFESNNSLLQELKKYSYISGAYDLHSISTTSFLNNTPILNEETFFNYNYDINYLKSEEIVTLISDTNQKQTLQTKYSYPGDSDVSNQVYVGELLNKNMIGTPLKTQTFKNGIKLSEQLTVYDQSTATCNLLLPKEIYAAKFPNKLPSVSLSVGNLERKITYNSYDNKGNILQYTPESGVPVSIIWGYNQTHPIAKIENATYTEIALYVSNLQAKSDTGTEADLLTDLDVLRNDLPNAMVTTYTYIPLVGVSTITDPKGDRMIYTYGSFGRLQFIKDKDLNILQKYCYNYKGEQIDCDINIVYRSNARTGSFTRNNCASGGTGSSVFYSQAEGVETSTISQADADTLGLSRFNIDGQANANTNGTCSYNSIARSDSFTKNNCAAGQIGSAVVYSQAEGAVTSAVSQADADALGISKFNTDGQANANINGTCITPLPAPTGLAFNSSTDTSLNFSWTAVSGATSYKIYKNGSDTGITSATNTGSLSGLTASTAYSIQVLAVNASSNSALSTVVSMATAETPVSNSCSLNFSRVSGSCTMYKNGSSYLTRSTSGTSSGTLTTGDIFYVRVNATTTYYKGITITSSVRGELYNFQFSKTDTTLASPTFTKEGSEEITIDCRTD